MIDEEAPTEDSENQSAVESLHHADNSKNKAKKEINKRNEKLIAVAVICVALVIGAGIFLLMQPHLPDEITKIVYKNQKYLFSHNIYDSDKIPMNNMQEIIALLANAKEIEIVFNDTSVQDFPYFTTTGYNIVYKIQQYSVYSRAKILQIKTQYLSNATFDKPTILLKGPNSGAEETSVSLLNNKVVVVQGLTHKELEMAGDKLVLAFLGVNLKKPNFTILQE